MLVDHILSEICSSRIRDVILIGNNTTLLDYEDKFMGSLHAIDSRSWTRVSSHYYLLRVLGCSWFSLVECLINFEIGFWGSQYSYRSSWSWSKVIYHDDMVYEGWIDSRFILVHKGILVIMKDYIEDNEQGS